jgi:GDPmannose 4,6-dehydratase
VKTVLISGITGQDGAYLSKHLLSLNYRVIGLVRSYHSSNVKGLGYLNILDQVMLLECDLMDISQIIHIMKQYQPDEIYNLAAQSSVSLSFKQPIGTFQFNTISVYNFLEAIRIVNQKIKFYQASSSEMYGNVNELPITENSIFHPTSPYAISKAAGHWACVNYRESYKMFVCCGILFNHESYLRNETFFMKKIIRDAIKISIGEKEFLEVGNIDIKRDFGYAPIYVEAMYLMMQQNKPDSYLICSGSSVSLRSIIMYLFKKLNINENRLIIDKSLYRPADILDIYGNANKAKVELGWEFNLSIEELIDKLINEEIKNIKTIN